jgi:hypothetical protein
VRDVHAWRARMTGTHVSFEVPGAGVVRHRSATEDREIAKVEGGADGNLGIGLWTGVVILKDT